MCACAEHSEFLLWLARSGVATLAVANERRCDNARRKSGGSGRTRTTGLTLIRGAL